MIRPSWLEFFPACRANFRRQSIHSLVGDSHAGATAIHAGCQCREQIKFFIAGRANLINAFQRFVWRSTHALTAAILLGGFAGLNGKFFSASNTGFAKSHERSIHDTKLLLFRTLICAPPESQGHSFSAWFMRPSLGGFSTIPFFAGTRKAEEIGDRIR